MHGAWLQSAEALQAVISALALYRAHRCLYEIATATLSGKKLRVVLGRDERGTFDEALVDIRGRFDELLRKEGFRKDQGFEALHGIVKQIDVRDSQVTQSGDAEKIKRMIQQLGETSGTQPSLPTSARTLPAAPRKLGCAVGLRFAALSCHHLSQAAQEQAKSPGQIRKSAVCQG